MSVETEIVATKQPVRGRKSRHRIALSLGAFVVTVALTFLGLLAITFFIGRIVPIDPVLAVVGTSA